MSIPVTFQMPDELHTRLQQLATDMGRTLEEVLNFAAEDLLGAERELVDRELQAERDFAEGRTVPHEEVVAWLRSVGTDCPLPAPLAPQLKRAS